ncbi:antibiotic biosynthesis monooxygenase [Halomonas sp. McH1-25]|uniref:putative quinol monooxygenase n=1 Tax=unclassified Halomonas TaxID=2609666 RepID=UPI001EF611E4|nr:MULTISPECIES: putative quinol monooxygenase [unclassified Halomonas]MCG7602202.1 antibiotic biosynthesis monooxygenase [Halomonas sp. McH1-25]MCP1344469.1 antibiotic biosynthesis monooxygenase [Halomonas sp. FL8]MCP1362790.1 antibiotic biosynthesis monooxygenase [Halomonas sp. BBD45]MCP1363711.1 antibiotic biosynthesis monooxygenase [Halomonas sp. BBD48]
MFIVLVEVRSHSGVGEDLRKLLKIQAERSLACEKGCLHFDVLVEGEDHQSFLLYEIYSTRESFKAHLEAEHTKQFFLDSENLIASKQDRFLLPA